MSTQETESNVNTESNEQMTVTVTRQPHCQVKFDISVKPEAVVAAYNKALKNINKEINVPGFRKGKTPKEFLEGRFKAAIEKEMVDIVLNTAFSEAVHLTKIHPYKEGHVKRPVVHECSKENGARMTIEFEARPHIPVINLDELKIEKINPPEITEEHKEKALQQVADQFIEYLPVEEERAVKAGDFIDMDLDILEDEGSSRRVVDNRRVEVDNQGLPVWLREKVEGLKAGESAEGETQPEAMDEGNPNFKPSRYRLTVHKIWTAKWPTMDDELAKKVGLNSLDQLKEKVNERLQKEMEETLSRQQMDKISNALIENYPLEIPESLISQDKKARLADYRDQMKSDEEKAYFQANRSQIEQMIENSSIHSLQLFFLLRRVAVDNHIEVTDADITEELNRQIALIPSGRSLLSLQEDREKLQEQLYSIAMDRKIKQFLLDKATQI